MGRPVVGLQSSVLGQTSALSEPNAWGWTARRSVQSEADEEFANDQRLTTNGGICGR